jgi:hypothetical protein
MKTSAIAGLVCFAAAAAAWMVPVYGDAPVKIAAVAPVEDLAAETEAKLAALDELLKDDESYAVEQKKGVAQAAGVLACMGQAIAEHPDKAKVKVAGPDLRNAALAIIGSKTLQEATAALGLAKKAAAGEASGKAETAHAWNKLINLHRLMEEVNARNSKLRGVLRRPKDPREDSLHASTLAVLAVVIHADTHEVKDPAQIPKWQGYALDFQQSMTGLSAALKSGQIEAAKEFYLKSADSCKHCHEAFRKEE